MQLEESDTIDDGGGSNMGGANVGAGRPVRRRDSERRRAPPQVAAEAVGRRPSSPTAAASGAEGEFQEITPPEVKAGFGVVTDGGGAFAFAVDR
jgi:hypothetical protein